MAAAHHALFSAVAMSAAHEKMSWPFRVNGKETVATVKRSSVGESDWDKEKAVHYVTVRLNFLKQEIVSSTVECHFIIMWKFVFGLVSVELTRSVKKKNTFKCLLWSLHTCKFHLVCRPFNNSSVFYVSLIQKKHCFQWGEKFVFNAINPPYLILLNL